MTAERRAQLRQEISAAVTLLSTLDDVAEQLMVDPDFEALQAVHVLLARQLERIDNLLLAMSADRLTDERRNRL